MSFSSIARAAADQQLIDRVTASAYKVIMEDPDKASTEFGKSLQKVQPGFSSNPVSPLMWPVAITTEDDYETALLGGNGSPGFDTTIISDEEIHDAVIANWPADQTAVIPPPIVPEPEVVDPSAPSGTPENIP